MLVRVQVSGSVGSGEGIWRGGGGYLVDVCF